LSELESERNDRRPNGHFKKQRSVRGIECRRVGQNIKRDGFEGSVCRSNDGAPGVGRSPKVCEFVSEPVWTSAWNSHSRGDVP
jgi:hypothetical protein